ncbi:MAG: glycosyltransferase [Phycisphaerales bacterium]|nr:glycosyltransferase [Phycisphaerales bacterium]
MPDTPSAVLTHHWLVKRRGGERVLEALYRVAPGPIYTLVHDPRGFGASSLARARVHTSFLQHIPGATRRYPMLLPLMPIAARTTRLPDADIVLCSDACLAKAFTAADRSKVICYCHSPMRYAWEPEIEDVYRRSMPPGVRAVWGRTIAYVRAADAQAARRVDLFVANSAHVAKRIQRCYGREATVVHPPVDLPARPTLTPREDFYLCVGQHVPYKRLDLALEACRKRNARLVVIGDGPDIRKLDPRRYPRVTLLGWQDDDTVRGYYRRAKALLFPGEEDFGIVPVEAIAHGCPVIAYGVGGATETVSEGRSGALFTPQTVEAMEAAMDRAADTRFDPSEMWELAQRFSHARFDREMRDVIDAALSSSAVRSPQSRASAAPPARAS